jgi:hypothetical protein
VSDCCVKPAVGLAEDADIPLTPTLSHREKGEIEKGARSGSLLAAKFPRPHSFWR